jgi:hypothetical protein
MPEYPVTQRRVGGFVWSSRALGSQFLGTDCRQPLALQRGCFHDRPDSRLSEVRIGAALVLDDKFLDEFGPPCDIQIHGLGEITRDFRSRQAIVSYDLTDCGDPAVVTCGDPIHH